VPWSSALDSFAYGTLNLMLGNDPGAPAIEAVGNEFAGPLPRGGGLRDLRRQELLRQLDGKDIGSWMSFQARRGSLLRVNKVLEGFRYYVSVSGMFDLPRVIGSFTTNLECSFGGLRGRPLVRGDVLGLRGVRSVGGKTVRRQSIFPPQSTPYGSVG